MKRLSRLLLVIVLLAALPLRAHAGELMAMCEAHHRGAAVADEHAHEQGDSHHDESVDRDGVPAHAASVCSICASCCAGASLAPDAAKAAVPLTPGSDRVAFFDRRTSGFVPAHLDRPPLAS